MKPIKEVRSQLNFYPQEIASTIRYFSTLNLDWNVYLPSIDKDLQRPFVWSTGQKRELINSIIIGRHIPHCAVVSIIDPNNSSSEIFQIIDGKQRLSTMIGFYKNEFTIVIEDKEYYFNELPEDYQSVIKSYNFRYYIVNDSEKKFNNRFTKNHLV